MRYDSDEEYFNSKMVRLIDLHSMPLSHPKDYFNSKMVRLIETMKYYCREFIKFQFQNGSINRWLDQLSKLICR